MAVSDANRGDGKGNYPQFDESGLDQDAASLPWRTQQVQEHTRKFGQITQSYLKAGSHGNMTKLKSSAGRLQSEQEQLKKWADQLLESANSFKKHVAKGDAKKANAGAMLADILASDSALSDIHDSIEEQKSPGYPRGMRKTMESIRSSLRQAAAALK